MSQKRALVIGNGIYNDRFFDRLQKAEADASKMAKVLSDRNIGKFEVTLLINKNVEILKKEIENFFQKGEREDFLLLYFSGHGDAENQLNNLYLIGKNTRSNAYATTAISSNFLKEVVASSKSRTKVLVLDCCNSGAYIRGAKGRVQSSEPIAPLVAGTGHAVLTASSASELAWEGDRKIPLSLFTYYLIEGLETGKADRSNTGNITIDDWYDYTYTRVKVETPEQTPSKQIEIQQGSLIIARNPVFKNSPFQVEASSLYIKQAVLLKPPLPFPLNVEQLKQRHILSGNAYSIDALAISPDGQILVSGGSDNIITSFEDTTIKVWNLSTGQLLRTLTVSANKINTLAISPDGQTLVSGDSSGNISVWNLLTGQQKHTFLAHRLGEGVTVLTISPDGQMIISSGDYDDTIKMWDISTGNLWRNIIYAHNKGARFLVVTPDGNKLISAQRKINIWNLRADESPLTLDAYNHPLINIVMSLDGRFLISYHNGGGFSSYRTQAYKWDIATGERTRLPSHSGVKLKATKVFGEFRAMVVSPDGQLVVSGGSNYTIKVWGCDTSNLLRTLTVSIGKVNALAISPDGQTIVSGGNNTSIEVWSTKK